MKTQYGDKAIFFLTILIIAGFLLGGCGSGGGGGGSDSGSSSGSGNVALFLADGPADDYENIWISVTRVLLIPSDRNPNGSPIVIFESDEGYELDLLELREQDFLLTVKKRVPAGWYSKIRLEVKDIWSEGGHCDDFKLPSNRIDLNPRDDFQVHSGKTLAIRLDIDANKSINLHEAGNSGKCIFRPVVFVEIDTIITTQRCPRILVGEIKRLLPSSDNVEGFVLDLFGKRGSIDVWLSDNPRQPTIIFGKDGFRVRRSELQPGQRVRVKGRLTSNGDLTASVVIIGDVLNLKGTVVSPVDDLTAIFPIWLDDGQELTGGQLNVEITPATFILLGCDEEVGIEAIQRGKRARIVGKYDVSNNVFRAVAVFLKPEKSIGDILGIERAIGGTNLIIKYEGVDDPVDVFLPSETPIFLQGDGEISLRLLYQILIDCGPKKVSLELDPEESLPTAKEVRVLQERLYGQVVRIESRNRVVYLDNGERVKIQEGATILLNTKRADLPVDFDDIHLRDELTLYGLIACDILDADFYAYIVLINESATK